MNKTRVESLRNVAIVGTRGAGKTSFAEAILFTAGAIPTLGSTNSGTSISDFEPEEIHRRMSVSTSVLSFSWDHHAITFLDTPGSLSLLGESLTALQAVDAVILVLSPSNGIRTEFKKLWTRVRALRLPALIFVNTSDKDVTAPDDIVAACREQLAVTPIPLSMSVGSGNALQGTIDVLHRVMIRSGRDTHKWQADSIPDSYVSAVAEAGKRIEEAAAEMDDGLLERYLSEGRLESQDLLAGLRRGVVEGAIVPLLVGDALKNIGMVPVLNAITSLLPSPEERARAVAIEDGVGHEVTHGWESKPEGPFAGVIFKTIIDPFVGRLSYIRIFTGTLQGDAAVYNASRKIKERSGHLYRLLGKRHTPTEFASAGDIVAIGKLKDSQTGDTLCDEREARCYPWPVLPRPVFSFAVEPKTSAEIDKVSLGLHKLIEEDPTLEFSRHAETNEMVLSGVGQLHLDLALEKLHRKYGADVAIHTPKIPYRETIKTSALAQGKYKKQTGGHGQYGDCWLEIAPRSRGGGFVFESRVVGGVIPRNFIPAVEKGVIEAMHHGSLAGFPVVDVQVAVYDGSYHVVDSSEMSFKIAGSMAFKKALEVAHPVLLEPMMTVEVDAPAAHVGAVIGDLNSRRGRILQVEADGHTELIKAIVPMAELMTYTTTLNALTGGGGGYTMEFNGYEEVPRDMVPRILNEQRAAQAAVPTH